MHSLIDDAADGRLPDWAEASPERRDHMVRVADVMVGWAREMGLDRETRRRWRATAMLHDALRDADPETLRPRVPPGIRGLPGGLLHGPAAAERLAEAGVTDAPLLLAVRWHTMGHPDFGRLGKALYLADFTEPGRRHASDQLAAARQRVPEAMDVVIREVAAQRIGRTLSRGQPLREPTVAFWNRLVEDA